MILPAGSIRLKISHLNKNVKTGSRLAIQHLLAKQPGTTLEKMPGLLMPMVEELVGINPVDLAHPLDSVGLIVSTDK